MPEVKRTCIECRFCKYKFGDWYNCKLFDMEVYEDDYCSFGLDKKDEDDPWDDRKVKDREID